MTTQLVPLLVALIAAIACPATASAQGTPAGQTPARPAPPAPNIEELFPGRVKVPDRIFDAGVDWLNTDGKIRLKDLRGKIVVLDFWTYCCINCIHVLPDLKYLEQKYANELVVIGVHSPKFDNEHDSANIRQAIVRYEIEHPVLNDANRALWRTFGVSGWPTLAVIDPEGYLLFGRSGEGNRELFDRVIGMLVDHHSKKGTLDRTPIQLKLERTSVPSGALRYPGKLLADQTGQRLFISDSNHNRIVVAGLDGQLQAVIGSGRIGSADGGYAEASFDHPQGMALVDQTLYVADTENHMIRAVDLQTQRVATLAGTGEQARLRTRGGQLKSTALNSPWDLLEHDGTLYIAMAGPHQIWRHVLGTDRIGVYAGTGREDVINGSRSNSAFAQPSGLATDGRVIFVADSEGSAIRTVPLDHKEPVGTIAGTWELPNGQSLFAFGDVDGKGREARLQHPLGVAYHEGIVYVADSYNHKIKRINLESGLCSSWLGQTKPGDGLDPVRFSEPAGLAVAGEWLFVADTNNHRILRINRESMKAEEFVVEGLTPPQFDQPKRADDFDPGDRAVTLSQQEIAADDKHLSLHFEIELPDGYKLNTDAPGSVRIKQLSGSLIPDAVLSERHEPRRDQQALHLKLPLAELTGEGEMQIALTYFYCRGGVGGLCKVATRYWTVPLKLIPESDQKVLEFSVK